MLDFIWFLARFVGAVFMAEKKNTRTQEGNRTLGNVNPYK